MVTDPSPPLIIDASNIAPGGTLVLLDALYVAAQGRGLAVRLLVRSTIAGRFPPQDVVAYDRFPIGRFEILREVVSECGSSTVLHFGNLATLRRIEGVRHMVYFHNLNIVCPDGGGTNGLRRRCKNGAMAFWMRNTRAHVEQVFVQTPLVADLLSRRVGIARERITVRPFYAFERPDTSGRDVRACDFVYPAGYYPHKNFARFLRALATIARHRGLRPSVILVSAPDRTLDRAVHACNEAGADVSRIGPLAHADCLAVMAKARAVVYPSLLESYGLPLVEAALLGRPVICADLPYAHAVIRPSMTFRPLNMESIAETLVKFLRLGAAPATLISHDQSHQLLSDLGADT